jgi:hypothetical protein
VQRRDQQRRQHRDFEESSLFHTAPR